MPTVTRSSATDEQRANYLAAGMDAQTALRAATDVLRARQALTGDSDETRAITVALLQLGSQDDAIQAQLIAFLAEQLAITPPTQADVDAIAQCARDLDGMVAGSVLTSDVMRVTAAVLTRWNATTG